MGGSGARAAPFVLGLTGPIGCGKTTVSDLLLALGARKRIDADREVHTLMAPGTETTYAIAATFGRDVLNAQGAVDRALLADIVFANEARLRTLEEIVHPAVRAVIRQRLQDPHLEEGVVIIDAVKLLQSDLLPLTDAVWVVTCSADTQRARLTDIRGMDQAAVEGRLRAQPNFDHPRVTRVIENSGDLEQLRAGVADAWRELTENT